MPTADVTMPQMGESITEGTITRWLKKAGERIGKDEPLFEISTDKVDAEIPSPVAGTVAKILVNEGQTVGIHTIVAQIESGDSGTSGKAAPTTQPKEQPKEQKQAPSEPQRPQPQAARPAPPPAAASGASAAPRAPRAEEEEETAEEGGKLRSSPLVRRLAKEHNIELTQVEGTGPGGRITKEDLLAFVERQKGGESGRVQAARPAGGPREPAREKAPAEQPQPAMRTREEVVPMTPMRKKIAERMVLSRHTAAHVTTVFRVDLTKVVAAFQRERERFERQEAVKLSYTPFFARAVIDGVKRFPILNSSISGENIVYKRDVHLGIAVALETGLIVPVIPNADEKSFIGLARAIGDLAERARTKRLAVSEVAGGTFTITNPGAYGSLFATPIINPPQVGIVGIGGVHKAPLVIDDAIAIRSIVHLSLSYDHRVIDGAVADQFMASVRSYLEHWEEDLFA